MSDPKRQVAAEHYEVASYDTLERWISYWYQVRTIAPLGDRSVLHVGVGNGTVPWLLRTQLGMDVTTTDYDARLNPDVTADVRALDAHFEAKQFDVVCAFQVLEHLPFADFEGALRQLARVARRHVVFSIPNNGKTVALRVDVGGHKLAIGRKIPMNRAWAFDGQHHWEVGTRGHSAAAVRAVVERVAPIAREEVYADYPYHRAFVLSLPGA